MWVGDEDRATTACSLVVQTLLKLWICDDHPTKPWGSQMLKGKKLKQGHKWDSGRNVGLCNLGESMGGVGRCCARVWSIAPQAPCESNFSASLGWVTSDTSGLLMLSGLPKTWSMHRRNSSPYTECWDLGPVQAAKIRDQVIKKWPGVKKGCEHSLPPIFLRYDKYYSFQPASLNKH